MFFRLLAALTFAAMPVFAQDDPLPSWNDVASKQAIVDFVTAAVTEGDPGYIEPEDRIATFDNDGTLWSEQPVYFQGLFVADRIKAMAPDHPEWAETEPFKSFLAGDMAGVAAQGEAGIMQLMAASHTGMTNDDFESIVTDWIATATHPTTGRPYTEMVFQPMLEVLDYLRANGFQTWIVSGGGIDFMRPWAEATYGIPPQQVIGSQVALEYAVVDGEPVFNRTPGLFFNDDKEGKPIGILRHIGRRPVIAFGNSDGDYQMLEYTTHGDGPRLGVYIHHTDADREWAYDRDGHIGVLSRGLDDAPTQGWIVVDMAADWNAIYPPEE